jgi:hypothetical protein
VARGTLKSKRVLAENRRVIKSAIHGSLVTSVARALVLAAGSVAPAQTLGDVARKEEARRKAVKTPSKVYTNDNLKADTSSPPPAAAAGSSAPPSPDVSQPPADSGAAAAEAKGEAYWKKRMSDAREALDRAKTFADALQVQINALTNDFTSRDDPAQRAVIGQNRQKALAQLDRLQQEITANTKMIATIQEEGRRAGIPAAWVR